MTYKAKITVYFEICSKHSTQSEHNVEFLNIKPGDMSGNRWALKG